MIPKSKRGLLATAMEKRVLKAAIEYAQLATKLGADRAATARSAGALHDAAVAYETELKAAKRRGQRR